MTDEIAHASSEIHSNQEFISKGEGACASVIINLPKPLSTNELYFNLPGRGRRKTKAYRIWQHEAGWAILTQKIKPIKGPFTALIELSSKSRIDPDNIKCIFDVLVRQRIIENDSPKFNKGHRVTSSAKVEGVRVTVTVTGVGS